MAIAGWDSYDGQGYEELVPESAYEPDVGEWGPEVGSSWYGEVSDWDSYEIETEAVELVSAGVEARALAGSDAPVELRSWALQGRWDELVGFAMGLDDRREELSAQVADQPDVGAGVVSVPRVAACVRNLVVESGDDVATVATRLGMDPAWTRGVLSGEVTQVDAVQVDRLCEALESSPMEVFGARERAMGALSAAMGRSDAWLATTKVSSGTASRVAEVVDGVEAVGSEEMARRLRSLDGEQLRDVVIALEEAHGELRGWSKDLDVREVDTARRLPVEERVPAARIAEQIAIFQIDSGDDLDTIAAGLGVKPEWIDGVVSGEIDSLSMAKARELCAGLEMSAEEVFAPVGTGIDATERAPGPATLEEDPYPSAAPEDFGVVEVAEGDLPFDPFIAAETWPTEPFDAGIGRELDFGP